MIPWFWALAAVFGVAGLYIGFSSRRPTPAGRGLPHHLHPRAGVLDVDVHLPGDGLLGRHLGLAFNTRLSGMMAQALAPTGALLAFLSLWTGALWGKPMWGTWWVWDARLTSELILLFLYIGFIALQSAIDDRAAPTRPGPSWRWSAWSTSRSSISR
jgi:heme exporter protein C